MSESKTKVFTNGISDSWQSSCQLHFSFFFQPIYSSFQLLFHFDSLNWVLLELLIILPLFFRLYGFGIQQKLSKFYGEVRNQLLNFMYLFATSVVVCSILQLLLPQPPVCATWDGVNYLPLRKLYMTPSTDIVVLSMLSCIFAFAQISIWRKASIAMAGFFVFLFLSAIFSGSSTVCQAIFSASIGIWLFFTFRFLPHISMPIFAGLLIICGGTYFGIYIGKNGVDNDLVFSSAIPGLRGCLQLAVNLCLYLRFALRNDDFNWFEVKWGNRNDSDSTSEGGAVIPNVLTGGESDAFGKVLRTDVFDSVIAFLVVLACNGIVVYQFDYSLFYVS